MNAGRHAVIIGGGLGGLATALRLSVRGWQVTVCEAGARMGGKMNSWEPAGYRFDTGPSLITMPQAFDDLFAEGGIDLRERVRLRNLYPLARYVYDDGAAFTYNPNMPDWLETVRGLDARDVDGFFRFMELAGKLYNLSKDTFLRRPLADPPDAGVVRALRHFPLRHGWGNYHRTVAAHFRSPRLQQLYDRYPTYVGSSPYRCPATLAMIPYLEYAFGGWYVEGGLYRIVEALMEALAMRGVTMRTRSRVVGVDRRDGRVAGVRLESGEELVCDAAVMNGDASALAGLLRERGDTPPGLRSEAHPPRGGSAEGGDGSGGQERAPAGRNGAYGLAPSERSMSGLVFLWAVRRTMPELHHHTVFFSADYALEFHQLFDERRFPDDPTVYISASSRTDRSVVPGGDGETLFVMANAPADAEPWDEVATADARAKVVRRLERSGFSLRAGDLVAESVWTPRRLAEAYSMPGGAIYGAHSHGWRRAFHRAPNRTKVKGLYCVGGSAHPGGGTPTVVLSSKIVAGLMEKDFG